jgi:hypothetical protein
VAPEFTWRFPTWQAIDACRPQRIATDIHDTFDRQIQMSDEIHIQIQDGDGRPRGGVVLFGTNRVRLRDHLFAS